MNAMNVHTPVLLEETLQALKIEAAGFYIDATFGRGGHAGAILERLDQNGHLLVIDKDLEAIQYAKALFANDKRVIVKQGSYSNLLHFCQELKITGTVKGVLLDLGVSSPQLMAPERGFSFQKEGPLDMRMDRSTGLSAADWVNTAEESEISGVLKKYGEERFHKRIARAIIVARAISPFTTTIQLAEVIAKANPSWEKHKHPATRCFQAIRIFINNELTELSQCLEQSLEVLAPQGRIVVISFHSLEDRMVKRFIQRYEQDLAHPIGLPIRHAELKPRLQRVGRKIKPQEKEIFKNSRARSAVLRVAQKMRVA
jgi:16S rRNA (cytosine1402-N4)-methyltransferase